MLKEATTLAAAGFEVEVMGGWFDSELKLRDQSLLRKAAFRFSPALDLTNSKSAQRFVSRAKTRMGKFFANAISRESLWQLGYFRAALTKQVKRSTVDLFITHSAVAMAAVSLARPQTKIAVDMEDWFSEELPALERNGQPVKLIRSLEERLLRSATYSSCTSKAMSVALAKEFQIETPSVIYNAFPLAGKADLEPGRSEKKNPQLPSIHWFSQTLGYGRGLEDLIGALPFVEYEAEIHLRGNPVPGFVDQIIERVPENWRRSIFFHPLVTNQELTDRIKEHDIGFAGELKSSLNKDLTVSNKILQYLVGGLAVVASDTEGHREVAALAGPAVSIYPAGDARALAGQLNYLLESREKLASAKKSAIKAAERSFCWEQQEPRLLALVRSALAV